MVPNTLVITVAMNLRTLATLVQLNFTISYNLIVNILITYPLRFPLLLEEGLGWRRYFSYNCLLIDWRIIEAGLISTAIWRIITASGGIST